MPLIRRLGDIGLYGSLRPILEMPYLEAFLSDFNPCSLYVGSMQNTKIEPPPDVHFCLEYAGQNRILRRYVGFSQERIYRQFAEKYPFGVVMHIVLDAFNSLMEHVAILQTNPNYHPPQELQQICQKFSMSPSTRAYRNDMKETLSSFVKGILNMYPIRSNPDLDRQLEEAVVGMVDYAVGKRHADAAKPLAPFKERDVLQAIMEEEAAMMGNGATSFRAYRREFLRQTGDIIWGNVNSHLKRDKKPIAIVLKAYHLTRVEDRLRENSRHSGQVAP